MQLLFYAHDVMVGPSGHIQIELVARHLVLIVSNANDYDIIQHRVPLMNRLHLYDGISASELRAITCITSHTCQRSGMVANDLLQTSQSMLRSIFGRHSSPYFFSSCT